MSGISRHFAAAMAVAAGALAVLVGAGACRGTVGQERCTDIPDGGCPVFSGVDPCVDPTCAAVYACNADQRWSLDHACAARDASAPDPTTDASASDAGAGGAHDAAIDAAGANGGPGCLDLEPPDCPLGLAAACPSGCCGCEELYVCVDGGWNPWGTCDAGALVAR